MNLLRNHLINRTEKIHYSYVVYTVLIERYRHKVNLVVNLLLVYQKFLDLFPLLELGLEASLDKVVYTGMLFVMK